MAKFREVETKVLKTLINHKEARSDDYKLIYYVFCDYVASNTPISYVCFNHNNIGLPSVESITRARRKLQAERPELRDPNAKYIRQEEEIEYRNEYRR